MSGNSSVASNPGFVAPFLRTSLDAGQAPAKPPASTTSTAALGLNPAQASALGATGGATGTANLSVATGSGAATRPSLADRALSFLASKFEAFCGKVESFAEGVKQTFGEAKAYISAKIDSLTHGGQTAAPAIDAGKLHSEISDMVLIQAASVTDDGLGAFLRGSEGAMPQFKEANRAETKAFTRGVAKMIGPKTIVAFAGKHYDPVGGAFLKDGKNAINPTNQAAVERSTASAIDGGLKMLFGHDAASSKAAAATNFSQACRDAYATGLRSIAESDLSAEQKVKATRVLQSNILLRVLMPALASYTEGTPTQNASMKEVAKALQNFINLGSFELSSDGKAKEPVQKSVLAALNANVQNYAASMEAMFTELAALGHADEGAVESAKLKAEPIRLGVIDVPQYNSDALHIEASRLGKIGA